MRDTCFNHLSHLGKVLLAIVWIISVYACKPDETTDPGFGPDGEPRILAIRIPDIPDQNSVIDQEKRQITVTVPASFSAAAIFPSFTLTPNTSVQGERYSLNIFAEASQQPVLLLTGQNKQNSYTLILKPASELALGTLTSPQTYTLSDVTAFVDLPVYNYVDGTGAEGNTVTLVHKASGERIVPTTIRFSRETASTATPQTDGAVILSIYVNAFENYYRPGEYLVELTKSNGRKALLSQPIMLQQGPTTARLNANYTFRINTGEYLLYGANIYRDSRYALRIEGRNQPVQIIESLGFIEKQPGLRFSTALSLKPGYYYAQLLANERATPALGRISVSDQPNPIVIEALSEREPYVNLVGPSYSFDQPIILTRGRTYGVSSTASLVAQNNAGATRYVQLTDLSNPSAKYAVSVSLESSIGTDRLVLPPTIPPGRYQFTIAVTYTNGNTVQGLPLERDVVVQ
jgi:hypothetical protein